MENSPLGIEVNWKTLYQRAIHINPGIHDRVPETFIAYTSKGRKKY